MALPGDRIQVRIAAATDAVSPGDPVRLETVKVDDSATPLDAARSACAQPALATARVPRGRSMRCATPNACRAHAVLAAAAPFSFAGGTRLARSIDQLDGTIGQGIGRFRVSVTNAPNPLEGAELAPQAASRSGPAGESSAAPPSPRSSGRLFRATSPLLKPTRDALAAARKALADLEIPSTLVMGERPGFERPSFELRVRGSFSAKGERVYARTPGALHPMRDDLPVNRLGLARWLVDPTQSAGRARRRQPALGADVRPRPGRDQRGFRLAGRAAVASRAARLAGHGIRREGLEPESADPEI